MDCPDCGNQLKPTDKYCTHCGNQVSDSQEKDPQKKKSMLRVIALALLSLLLVAGVAYGTYSLMCHANADKTSQSDENVVDAEAKQHVNAHAIEFILPTIETIEIEEYANSVYNGVTTIIIDGKINQNQNGDDVSRVQDGEFYYFEGSPDADDAVMKKIGFDSLHAMLAEKNHELITKIDKIKKDWAQGKIDDANYRELVLKARMDQVHDPNAHRPVVLIKPTDNASYADIVRILDEMNVNQISTYQIEKLTPEDSVLFEKTIGHPIGSK